MRKRQRNREYVKSPNPNGLFVSTAFYREAMKRKRHRPRKNFEDQVINGRSVPFVWTVFTLDRSPPLEGFRHEREGVTRKRNC